jgi:iron complex outermembrane receptor protein
MAWNAGPACAGITGRRAWNPQADAEIKGVELEFTWYALDNLRFDGTYAYLDTKYSNFFVPDGFVLPPSAPPIRDREGNQLRRAPENAYTLRAKYDRSMSSGGNLALQANWRYIGKNYGDPDNLEYGAIPSYSVLGARLTYDLPDGNWSVSLWADNLLDEDYFLHNFPTTGSGWAVPGPPRTYGVTVNWSL